MNRSWHSRSANIFIEVDDPDKPLIIRDMGPWNEHLTITNDAEDVVRRLSTLLDGRRLFYYDSEGDLDELLIENSEFAGFKPLSEEERNKWK